MKVCLVTAFPPSRGDLNEYGYQLASAIRRHEKTQLVVVADKIDKAEALSGFEIDRCWSFNSLINPFLILKSVRRHRPSVVWMNMGFATFANRPVAAFLSCMIPALLRANGFFVHVTLHSLFEATDLEKAGVRFPGLYRMAGRMATRCLLRANDLAVLLPSYHAALLEHYGADPERVHYRPHGTFDAPCAMTTPRKSEARVVLAFGYWGTYKRLEVLLEAMHQVNATLPDAMLVIAGSSHPQTPDYLDELKKQVTARGQRVEFKGYVAENDLPAMFAQADVLAMPYVTAAGASGVMHQACEHGLPMVAADIPELRELAQDSGMAAEFYPPSDVDALARLLLRMLTSEDVRIAMRNANRRAAEKFPIQTVVQDYLDYLGRSLEARPANRLVSQSPES